MSLQVWLPLNGDTHNQGLLQLPNLSQNNFTQQTDGKIGKCYSGQGIYHLSDEFLGNSWSLCAWVKSSAWSQNNDIILCKNTTESTSCQFYFSIINGANLNLGINAGSTTVGFSYTFATNTWYHVAATYDGSKYVLYINGEQKKTGTCSNALLTGKNNLGINCRSINANGTANTGDSGKRLNDVRIYNHALSPKEVEEIAKGLVLHYKLDDRFCEATTNLYSTLDGVSTSCYNGSNGKYGYGSNSDVYKTTGIFNGRQSLKVYMGTSGNPARPYPYFSNLFVSDGTNAPAYKTLSFDYYGTIGAYLNFYKLGSGSGTGTWKNITNNTSGNFTNSGNIAVTINKWQHIELTLHGTTNANAEWGYCILGDAHTSNTSNYWLFANIQLETKDHATGFAGYGATRSPTTIYDSSGYSNNGTIVGDLTAAASSPRYSVAIYKPNGAYIRIDNRPNTIGAKDAITVSMWVNFSTWGNCISCTEGGGWNFEEAGGGLRFPIYIASVGYKVAQSTITSASLKNAWHMLTGTMDSNNVKFYIDGEEAGTIATGSANGIGYANNYIFIGGEAGGNSTSPASSSFVGTVSDTRIYSTALTPNQVKELYNTSMSIDSSGNIHARELVEL